MPIDNENKQHKLLVCLFAWAVLKTTVNCLRGEIKKFLSE